MKGVLLAGGLGTRLLPMTRVISKQLLPVYDKPMVYYPLTTLMLAGVREVLVITTPRDQPLFQALLGDGAGWGIRLRYAVQARPEGIAQALIIGEDFLEGQCCALILGDNLFYGHGLPDRLRRCARPREGATILACRVRDPERYGVVSFDAAGRPAHIVEKPASPASEWVVTGLYFYDGQAPGLARALRPSARGELEISELNRAYLEQGTLRAERLGRGVAWFDTGTPASLLRASELVRSIEERQGLKIACPEEVAWRMGFIGQGQLAELARGYEPGPYRDYLRSILAEEGGP